VCAEIGELAAVLSPSGAPSAAELRAFITDCAAANTQNWSSMQQDVSAGRRTEIDELNGWVVARATVLGTRCAENTALVARVRAAAAG